MEYFMVSGDAALESFQQLNKPIEIMKVKCSEVSS